ncbi:UNVERIFIED_CONTAM: hypothetical protein ABIC26_005214 [Paenibacillus sp. PvR008]
MGRDLRIIEKLMEHTPLTVWSKRQYRQQREMADQKKHSVADRMVSIEQPHVRPIVRGKPG